MRRASITQHMWGRRAGTALPAWHTPLLQSCLGDAASTAAPGSSLAAALPVLLSCAEGPGSLEDSRAAAC